MSLPNETTQLAVITALVDGLTALEALSDVTITDAPLDRGKVSGDQIAVIEIPDGDETWNGLGNRKRNETYVIRMGCLVFEDGAGQEAIRACNERAYALYEAVAGYIRSNPHYGGVTIAQMSGVNYTPGYEEQRRFTRLEWGVRVSAQIEVI